MRSINRIKSIFLPNAIQKSVRNAVPTWLRGCVEQEIYYSASSPPTHISFARRLRVPFAFDAFHLKWRTFQRDASSSQCPASPSTCSLNKHKYDFFMDNNNFCNLWRLKSELTRAHAAAATQRERVFVAFAAKQIKKKQTFDNNGPLCSANGRRRCH